MLRRVGSSILAVLAPEIVAFNAWSQYCTAKSLMASVNRGRGLRRHGRRQPLLKRLGEHVRGLYHQFGELFPHAANEARNMLFHRSDRSAYRRKQRQSQNERLLSQLDNDELPWTMGTAFYACYGGAILVSDYGMAEALSSGSIRWLANDKSRSQCLLPIQRAALQDPSKASGLAKLIACTQALWFCAECVARLCNNMAVSLLELNTFAHCISAFCIYVFWWHKPYEALTHAHVNSIELYQDYLFSEAVKQLAVTKRGRPLSSTTVFEYGFPLTINEQTPDASLAPLGSMETLTKREGDPDMWPLDHRVKIGATIPSTGLVFTTPRTSGAYTIWLTDEALVYFKQLWLVRLACNVDGQPSPLGVLSSWKYPVCHTSVQNWDPLLLRSLNPSSNRWPALIIILVALVYGGMHLLAWQYRFHTSAESAMWRTASLITAASGIVLRVEIAAQPSGHWTAGTSQFFAFLLYLLLVMCCTLVLVGARSFLVVESFRALPNSPVSVYEIPRWTSYLPHF
jgi:hypothetical protein